MKGIQRKPTDCARSNLLREAIWDLCKNQTLNESLLTFNQKNVETNAFDVQILVFVRCHLRTTPGLNNKCPNVWKPHKLFSSKFLRRIIPGIIAYPAGCTLVLYNPRKNKQQHITNPSKKTITSAGWWVLALTLTSFQQTIRPRLESRLGQSHNVNLLYLMCHNVT